MYYAYGFNLGKKNACYKCENRTPGCHSSCESYKSFKDKNEQIKKESACIVYPIGKDAKRRGLL